MEITQLRSFLQVADAGTITRAAEQLYLTQPAVTQQIHALERELGAPLFDRLGRGMRLTAAGRILQDYARKSLAALDECRLVLREWQSGATGPLTVGAGVTTSIFYLPRWLRQFKESHPGIELIVRTGHSREIVSLLLDGAVDLGLITSPTDHPQTALSPLFAEEIALVAPPDHPLAGAAVSPGRLASVPLILFPRGTGFREYLDRFFASVGCPVSVKMETDSVEAIKSFVGAGLGASLLPLSAVQQEIDDGTLARVTLAGIDPPRRETFAAYRSDRYLCAAAKQFLELLTT
ncbi:MAG: LysR family transcriptional regulator [Armatimonadota bacterium]